VFVNKVLRRVLGPKRDEVKEGEKNCIMRNLTYFVLHQVLLG
jgi:hypothetical protein